MIIFEVWDFKGAVAVTTDEKTAKTLADVFNGFVVKRVQR